MKILVACEESQVVCIELLFLVLLQLWLHNGDKREPEFIKFDMVLICAFSQNI